MRRLLGGFLALLLVVLGAFVRYGPHARIATRVEDVAQARFGLVLGTGRIRGAGEVSQVYAARMQAAAALMRSGKIKVLIASGYRIGAGRINGDYDELADMREDLLALGVPEAKLALDPDSYRTIDSIQHAACLVKGEPVIVISQTAHVARALFLSWAQGLNFTGFAAIEPPPKLAIQGALLEFLARLKAVRDVVLPPPAGRCAE